MHRARVRLAAQLPPHASLCYRVGDYRMLCEIRDDELVVLAIEIGHRRDIYG
ncbi:MULTISPECIES: type II toxin-antitoxin system RelE/ParE family toxin [unclassified Adlercreutzia]|uniref:type II toxin-antitoxin system RelE family toxin n=1 Tax=unclassified Adlercreutzia TaxID=2636013 RepID=UPI0013EDAF22|nr:MULTISPECIES: type II toxin-antitoxin system RelE/ParE family toxin [unclassified Adlercreutzia]